MADDQPVSRADQEHTMNSIDVDDTTAQRLALLAEAEGCPAGDLVAKLVERALAATLYEALREHGQEHAGISDVERSLLEEHAGRQRRARAREAERTATLASVESAVERLREEQR